MLKFLIFFLVVIAISMSCNKGLAPTEVKELPASELQFASQVTGGDLTGEWVPRQENALEARLVDPSQLKGLVDTLYLETQLSGSIEFRSDYSFDIDLIIQIEPIIKVGNMTLTIPPFTDSLKESGTYEQNWSNMIVLPLQRGLFKVDTLGYTANNDTLFMVTLPTTFPFPGFDYIQYYLIFHFERAPEQTVALFRRQQNTQLEKHEPVRR